MGHSQYMTNLTEIESLKGTVQNVVFSNPETGFKVLRIKMATGPVVSVTGEFGPDMVEGAIASFHGSYKTHPKYGSAFRIKSYNISHNVEELGSIRLFIDEIAPGIGTTRSNAIIKHFGKDVFKVLGNPYKLMEVEGVGEVSANSLADAWNENKIRWDELRSEFTLRAFLSELGIKEKRAKKILGHFGGGLQAEIAIKENPYVLAEMDGFGFSIADFIAKQLGHPLDSSERLRAFLLYVMNVLCPAMGHLFYTAEEAVVLVNEYAKKNETKFLGKSEIDCGDVNKEIQNLISRDLCKNDLEAIYSKASYLYETRSAQLLAQVMNTPSDLILLNTAAVDDYIVEFEDSNGMTLSQEQKDALHYFAEKKVFIITGPPGSGKTLITKAVVGLAKRMHLTLTCMAPTGISAKKLSSTVNHEASTIHRGLGFRGKEWVYNEQNKFETDVIILDESSMIDQEVFYRLMSALRSRVHMVIVGDDNQLPSVGAGNVLKELINSKAVPVIRLETIFRQAEASDIIKVAHKIKNGDNDLSLFKPDPEADVFFIRESNLLNIERFLVKLAQKFKDERRLFQIITPRNEGPLSVSVLNKILQEVLNPPAEGLEEINLGQFMIRRGDRIVIKKNDYENMVFNGDTGKVIRIGGGTITVSVDERQITLSVEDLNTKMKLAYAISVHGCQGQEYPYVILPFVNQFGKMLLQRNLLYTAITRAKTKVISIGHASALERAINNASVYKRNTKLGDRVCLRISQTENGSSTPIWQEEQPFSPHVLKNEEPSSSPLPATLHMDSIDQW